MYIFDNNSSLSAEKYSKNDKQRPKDLEKSEAWSDYNKPKEIY